MKPLEGNSGLSFPNIGMIYSEKTLGEIGIHDRMTMLISLRPYDTGKKLSKIVSIIDNRSNELLAIEQWRDGILATLYQSN